MTNICLSIFPMLFALCCCFFLLFSHGEAYFRRDTCRECHQVLYGRRVAVNDKVRQVWATLEKACLELSDAEAQNRCDQQAYNATMHLFHASSTNFVVHDVCDVSCNNFDLLLSNDGGNASSSQQQEMEPMRNPISSNRKRVSIKCEIETGDIGQSSAESEAQAAAERKAKEMAEALDALKKLNKQLARQQLCHACRAIANDAKKSGNELLREAHDLLLDGCQNIYFQNYPVCSEAVTNTNEAMYRVLDDSFLTEEICQPNCDVENVSVPARINEGNSTEVGGGNSTSN